ncbi:Transcription elongation factor B polypeptide 3, partial [Stegodyphus mimosarum]
MKNDTERSFDCEHSNSEIKAEKRKIPDVESFKCRESEPKAKKIKHEASFASSTSHSSQSKHEPEKKEKVDSQKKKEGKEKAHNHTNHFSSQKDSFQKHSRPADLQLKASSSKKQVKTGQLEDKKSHQSKNNSKDKKSKGKLKIQSTEAFTSSEVSFEDCLGFNDIVSVKRKKSSIKASSSSSKKPKISTTSSKASSSSSTSSSSSSSLGNTYKLDAEKKSCIKLVPGPPLNPIHLNEVDILSTLPQPQPNYRPLPPRNTDGSNAKKKVLTNEDAIRFTSSRREKTAVYSGRRNAYFLGKQEVPSLFDICTRILIDNIDAIEYMGEVPYFLVKPILERCNPMQLYTIEHYNPYLLEDTHDLWEVHCRRDYRTEEPQENETWRDLYWRCCEEREIRLKSVTANISASMSKSNPVRQVKLAYVDSVVKPPRDVARRQAKNGTGLPVNHKMKPGPSSKATPRPSAPSINVAVASTSKAQTSFVPKKPKIAPLMAKTLKSMKQCFRRK